MKIGIDLIDNMQSTSGVNNKYTDNKSKAKDVEDSLIDSKQTNYDDKSNDVKETSLSSKSFDSILNKVESNNKSTDLIKNDKKATNKKVSKKEEIDAKIEELEEKMEKLSTQEILQALNSIFSMISEAFNSNTELSGDINNKISESINSILNQDKNSALNSNMMNALQNAMSSTKENPATVLANILEMMKSTDLDEFISKDNLSIAEKLLEQLNVKIEKDSSTNNAFVKDLINELKTKLQSLEAKGVNSNNNTSNDTTFVNVLSTASEESSLGNNSSQSNNSSSNGSNSSASKDEKVLNSILKDNNSNTFSSFTNSINRLNNTNVNSVNGVQSVDADNIAQDIVRSVRYMAKVNIKEMVVKVNPANLGEITIKLVEENGDMKLNIKANSKETYTLLSQQLGDITDQLKDQNIKIQDVKLSLYEDDTTFFKGEEFNHQSSNNEDSRQQSTNKARNIMMNEEEEIDSMESEDLSNINMLA